MRPEPRPYERYRHFKGRDYQVLLLATDAGSGRKSVVYQGLYEPFRIYVRDLEEFLSDVDKKKYPYAQQKERFALICDEEGRNGEQHGEIDIHIDPPGDRPVKEREDSRRISENTEKLSLDHKKEGRSIFKARGGADRVEDRSIRVVEPGSTEKHTAAEGQNRGDDREENTGAKPETEKGGGGFAVDPSLTQFLDAETVEKKLEVLFRERNRLTPKTLTLIELSLGLEVQEGSAEDRYQRIRSNLQTRQKYERHRPG